jgi:hypothetical protein
VDGVARKGWVRRHLGLSSNAIRSDHTDPSAQRRYAQQRCNQQAFDFNSFVINELECNKLTPEGAYSNEQEQTSALTKIDPPVLKIINPPSAQFLRFMPSDFS